MAPLHHHHLLPFLLLLLLPTTTFSTLTLNHYSKTCPDFHHIMEQTTTSHQISHPTTAAATLRLFFHDCFITGCDSSTLISTTPLSLSSHHPAERDADVNLSLPGDAFDLVVRAKAALELACPGVVSCSDILSVATRNLVVFAGGPFYPVLLGRRDGLVSEAKLVDGHLPLSNTPIDEMLGMFEKHGFDAREMVALSGAHTIGFSHCKEFADGIYNSSGYDPTYNPKLAVGLQKACKGYHRDPTLSVFNDIITPSKFDNMYFKNLPRGLGILPSDRVLYTDPRTRPYVELYARDQDAFFKDFASAMQKLSLVGVKTGKHGEIRRRCDAFNNIET